MAQALQEDVDFLAHFGVKGMKWGVRKDTDSGGGAPKRDFGSRNNKQVQRRVDKTRKIASGKASLSEKTMAALFNIPVRDIINEQSLRGAAQTALDREQRIQRKITEGKKRTTDVIARLNGVNYRDLDFSYDE